MENFWKSVILRVWQSGRRKPNKAASARAAATFSHRNTHANARLFPGGLRFAGAFTSVPRSAMSLILKTQEIPFDAPESCNRFLPGPEKPLVATPAAIAEHQNETILRCLTLLQQLAEKENGIDYLQVFQNTEPGKPDLWFMEDGPGGAITALLPSDY